MLSYIYICFYTVTGQKRISFSGEYCVLGNGGADKQTVAKRRLTVSLLAFFAQIIRVTAQAKKTLFASDTAAPCFFG